MSGDAAATANNVLANEPVFRLAIGASLLAVVFHPFRGRPLLRPVQAGGPEVHVGEILAIRQQIGGKGLPEYVGNIEAKAPYRPERD